MLKKSMIGALALIFAVSMAYGQLTQVGMINGVVTSSDGTPLPGVTVTIKSPALVLPEMTTITSENGRYRFPGLAPGIYEVHFALEGMGGVVNRDVRVSVGVTTTVDAQLSLQTIEEEILVEGKAPTVDRQTATKAANLDSEFLDSIPALRTIDAYFNMTPGVTSRTSHGSSERDNAYNLDGVNLADPAVGTQGVFFGMDIMEEISVQSGGLKAEYGAVRGAVINVVSKSGGNKFSGTASVYYRHESFQSDNTTGTPLEGEQSGYKYEVEPGLTLGGPIVKDKLWFFANFSFNKREQYVPGYPYNQDTEIPADDMRPYPYLKLTFQPNQNNKFVFSYNFSDIRRNHRGASRYETEEGTWKQETPTHVFNAHWTHSFGSSLFMNIKAGGYYSEFNLLAKSDRSWLYEYTTGYATGSYGYDDMYLRHRLQTNADATWFVDDFYGAHEIKFGAEFQYGWSTRKMDFKGQESELYPGFYNYFQYLWLGETFYGAYYKNLDVKENMANFGLFVQDTWNIGKNVTLNLGLRFDHQRGIIPAQAQDSVDAELFGYVYNTAVPETFTPMKWTTLAPRVNVIYDILSDGTTLFKASYSRYFMANVTQWFSGANPNTFVAYEGYLFPDGTLDMLTGISVPTEADLTEIGYMDYDLKAPYVDEVTVGVERELWEDWSVGLRYIRKWDRNLLEDANAKALDMDALMEDGSLVWTNYNPVTVTDPYDGGTVTFWNQIAVLNPKNYMVNPPGAKRDYDGIEFTVEKRYAKGWSLKASYVWQKSRGLIGTDFDSSWGGTGYYNNPNSHENSVGTFPFERRHQFKLQGLVKGPWGINFSGYFRFLSGQAWTRTVTSDYLGLALSQGSTTINAEERGSRKLPDVSILDLRLEKAFKFKPVTLRVFADVFNVFNVGKATGVNGNSSHPSIPFEEMSSITDPRVLRLGAKIEF